jgi:cobalt-zinc-cadmium efflux system membrane fusion protein
MLKASLPAGSGVVAGGATSVAVFGPAPAGAVAVPAAAVTSIDGHDVVFVPSPHGFVARRVVAGATNDGMAVLLAGVRPGDRIVTSGTSALKALAQAN